MRNFVLFLFLFLPRKVYVAYTVLCFYMYIYTVRYNTVNEEIIDTKVLSSIMSMSINKDTILLPMATFRYLWTDKIREEKVRINNREINIENIIKKSRYNIEWQNMVSEIFIDKLPNIVKYKLNIVKQNSSRQQIENMFTGVLFAA